MLISWRVNDAGGNWCPGSGGEHTNMMMMYMMSKKCSEKYYLTPRCF